MISTIKLTTTSALVLSLAASPLFAQSATDTGTKDTSAQSQNAESTGTDQATTDSSNGDQSGEDILIVTVGDKDILSSDVSAAISLLPPQFRQQPREMLIPMAINQLIARELILRAAMAENLDKDPEVVALVGDAQQANEQDAMIQVWLRRELDERVTDKEIQAEYDEVKASTEQEIPPLEAVRAQIEQQLRQQAFSGLQENLREDVMITYYGPDGTPTTASSGNVEEDKSSENSAQDNK